MNIEHSCDMEHCNKSINDMKFNSSHCHLNEVLSTFNQDVEHISFCWWSICTKKVELETVKKRAAKPLCHSFIHSC